MLSRPELDVLGLVLTDFDAANKSGGVSKLSHFMPFHAGWFFWSSWFIMIHQCLWREPVATKAVSNGAGMCVIQSIGLYNNWSKTLCPFIQFKSRPNFIIWVCLNTGYTPQGKSLCDKHGKTRILHWKWRYQTDNSTQCTSPHPNKKQHLGSESWALE